MDRPGRPADGPPAAEGATLRVLVVNVNTSTAMTATIDAAARRAASPGTEIVALTPRAGAPSVDSAFESYISAVAVADAVTRHDGPWDAAVLAGFGEHGRDALQELCTRPIVEICEASAHVAMLVGRRYGVVTTLRRSVGMIEDRLLTAGLAARCAGVRACGWSTAEVDADPAGVVAALVEQARLAVEVDGAEAICLGCAGMAGLEEAVTAAVGVPVVDGVAAAVRLAEAVVGMGLATSKVGAYAPLAPGPITGWPLP